MRRIGLVPVTAADGVGAPSGGGERLAGSGQKQGGFLMGSFSWG